MVRASEERRGRTLGVYSARVCYGMARSVRDWIAFRPTCLYSESGPSYRRCRGDTVCSLVSAFDETRRRRTRDSSLRRSIYSLNRAKLSRAGVMYPLEARMAELCLVVFGRLPTSAMETSEFWRELVRLG